MAFSDYNYIAPTELAAFIPTMASVTDATLAAQFISTAEVIIDAFAGPGPQFYPGIIGNTSALVASGATTVTSTAFGGRGPNHWAAGGVYLKVVSSTEASIIGVERLVVASSSQQVTLATGFDAAIPTDSRFRIRQESVFPRLWDTNGLGDPDMPQLLKRAVAAQVEWGIAAGSEAFGLGDPDLVKDSDGAIASRTYGSGYSESRDTTRAAGLAVYIAPKARVFMRRLLSSAGNMRG